METIEALARLGLQDTASRDEIERAWRAAMKTVHPDTGSHPDGRLAVVLNQARAVALAGLPAASTELVTRDQIASLVRAEQEQLAHRVTVSERAMQRVVMHHVGELAFRRRQRTTAAAASAGVTAVLAIVAALVKVDTASITLGIAAGAFGVVGAVVGFMAWATATRERALQLELDDVAETLSDRQTVARTFAELDVGQFFTREDLHAAIAKWASADHLPSDAAPPEPRYFGRRSVPLFHTARTLGPVDFGKLLITKGLELVLITESEDVEPGVRRRYGYRVM